MLVLAWGPTGQYYILISTQDGFLTRNERYQQAALIAPNGHKKVKNGLKVSSFLGESKVNIRIFFNSFFFFQLWYRCHSQLFVALCQLMLLNSVFAGKHQIVLWKVKITE